MKHPDALGTWDSFVAKNGFDYSEVSVKDCHQSGYDCTQKGDGMEIPCEHCGQMCEVEEAKPGAWYAWCDECRDYASEKNYFWQMVETAADAWNDKAKYEGVEPAKGG